MGARLLVTIGSDKATNWVRTPDGQKFNLGSVSVLNFVVKACLGGSRKAREVLNKFLKGEEVMLRVDEDRLWSLLAPRRSRWAVAHPFIPTDRQTSQGKTMDTISSDLDNILQHIGNLNRVAGRVPAKKMAEGVGILQKFVAKVVDQSSNTAYLGLGAKVFDAGVDRPPEVTQVEDVDAAKVAQVLNPGEKTVSGILEKMSAVDEKIGQLVESGKQFDHVQARLDVYELTQRVASLTASTDLMESWAQEDLAKYAARANHLHGLFFPKGASAAPAPEPSPSPVKVDSGDDYY